MIRIAIVENIAEQKQTPSAQKGVIEYCMQPQKTQADERTIYVSGVNCVPEFANESFLATQNLYGHEPDGVRFYHYVQSFSPSENVTPELAHRIALELASYFGNREVLVATHLDSDHLHSHFVIDSYDIDSGKKLHMNKFTLADLRNQSDALCMKYGLSVLPQYDPKVKSTNLRPREYRAAMKGESWKMRLCAEIDEVMRYARTEDEFKKLMRRRGYGVIWEPGRKYITYVVGENKRVRDIRLHETKYEKRCMERELLRETLKKRNSSAPSKENS
ncbi:MAG: relaxase/mobilization nuclease domain-containing protein [Clostridia bacterium]|nr:relaxase/mobilization nuclease domain-containing protein [Clostridia bacterium]